MQEIEKDSIMGLAAISSFIADKSCGFDPREFLSPGDWFITLVNGRPEVCLYERAMRILATFSANPERGHAITDELVSEARKRGQVR